jgi:hypothetical protein
MFFKKNDDERWQQYDASIVRMRAEMSAEIDKLRETLDKKPLPDNFHDRLADLEVKVSKLWMMLTEKSPTGKDKLSRYGRMFGGANRDKL